MKRRRAAQCRSLSLYCRHRSSTASGTASAGGGDIVQQTRRPRPAEEGTQPPGTGPGGGKGGPGPEVSRPHVWPGPRLAAGRRGAPPGPARPGLLRPGPAGPTPHGPAPRERAFSLRLLSPHRTRPRSRGAHRRPLCHVAARNIARRHENVEPSPRRKGAARRREARGAPCGYAVCAAPTERPPVGKPPRRAGLTLGSRRRAAGSGQLTPRDGRAQHSAGCRGCCSKWALPPHSGAVR